MQRFRKMGDARRGIEAEIDLLAVGESVEGMVAVLDNVGVSDGMDGSRRRDAEDILFEETEYLGSTFGGPLLSRDDGSAIGEAKRIEQGIGGDLRFVVVVAGDVLGGSAKWGKENDSEESSGEGMSSHVV